MSSLTPARFDPKTIDKLVMKDKRLELLKKLSKNFMGESEIGKPAQSRPWMADFVVGKGNSLIFLLHGSYHGRFIHSPSFKATSLPVTPSRRSISPQKLNIILSDVKLISSRGNY